MKTGGRGWPPVFFCAVMDLQTRIAACRIDLKRVPHSCGFRNAAGLDGQIGVHFTLMRRPGEFAGASPLRRTAPIQAFVFAFCALLTLNGLAFDTSLPPEEIEEAYSLGQTGNHQELAEFLKPYEHDFLFPNDHPPAYVQSVEFQTPYEQIVLRSLHGGATYGKFQADEAYRANPGLVLVRVVVALRINYGGPLPPADSFRVGVSQAKPIEAQKTTNTLICDPYSQVPIPNGTNSDCSAYTREILLSFDAGQFAPGMATVKVALPFSRSLETKYNLDKLK